MQVANVFFMDCNARTNVMTTVNFKINAMYINVDIKLQSVISNSH